jgi:hypothetical protein
MIDGSTMAGRQWLGVSLSSPKAFMFWRVLELPDSKSPTMAYALVQVVDNLTVHL